MLVFIQIVLLILGLALKGRVHEIPEKVTFLLNVRKIISTSNSLSAKHHSYDVSRFHYYAHIRFSEDSVMVFCADTELKWI